jgi:hypothetical protein
VNALEWPSTNIYSHLAGNEDEQDDLGLHHAVDETREQLRLVRRESVMARGKTLQANGELDVAGANDVLNLEVLLHVSRGRAWQARHNVR